MVDEPLLAMHDQRVVHAHVGVEDRVGSGQAQPERGQERRRRDDIRMAERPRSSRVPIDRVGVADRVGEPPDVLAGDLERPLCRIRPADRVAVHRHAAG